jgi:hypothetical protein
MRASTDRVSQMLHGEPVVCVPKLICSTCNMELVVEGRVSLGGTVWVRYPCDSCNGDGLFKVELPHIKAIEWKKG